MISPNNVNKQLPKALFFCPHNSEDCQLWCCLFEPFNFLPPSSQYKESTLQSTSVYRWIEKFKNGRTSVTRKERVGRPSIFTTDRG